MTFKVGDKVRFKDASGKGWAGSVHGQIYTITEVDPDRGYGSHSGEAIVYVDAPAIYGRPGAYSGRFELVREDKTLLEFELEDVVTRMRNAGYDVDVTVTCPPTERKVYAL